MFDKSIQQTNKYYLFIIIVLVYILLSVIMNIIITEEHYYRTFSGQLNASQINRLFDFKEKWSWLGYLFVPVTTAVKILLVSLVLKTGVILSNLEVKLKQLFHVALTSEIVFVFAMIIKTTWLFFYAEGTDLGYIQSFFPLSAINLVDYKEIAPWSIYAIQTLNIFEFLYWLVLAYLISPLIKRGFWRSFEFILSTYGLGLFFWIILVVFISSNLS
jgi:hypothetical protein